ncbi:unnamed protein product [Eruca vesicaria subsp. sativa]|uniref:Uncharacterized protein n=1 Tax=Eruca vesicaria subsp. sativa TaxID=29727 RepID=A0ABC8JXZ8_ERUVS|nr:unnamed protein product [Eruca vesicaria subsp. sativa]
MKSYNNVQLAEETVAHHQVRALERVCAQNGADIFIDDKYNIYDAEKTYEVKAFSERERWRILYC